MLTTLLQRQLTAALTLTMLLSFATAAPHDDILAGYAAAAKQADPAFSGFSAARGEAFHRQSFAGGKVDTPACRSCHGSDIRQKGQTPAGKIIEPMAISLSPARYSDLAKVEKWFRRNCQEVLGRECSTREKGDWLTYVFQR
ncbi:MAG TPA: DUF1924 domain-containing protein [Accumulibacter sp.]|jgi:hypothetical protein|nr:DUF1924 domain-containing protein [Accumulibacter sp.]